jgi:hypothetical protein
MPPKHSPHTPLSATNHADRRTNIPTERMKVKAEKCKTARNLWVPAINNHGGHGRWAFLEIIDPWDAVGTIRSTMGVLGTTDAT